MDGSLLEVPSLGDAARKPGEDARGKGPLRRNETPEGIGGTNISDLWFRFHSPAKTLNEHKTTLSRRIEVLKGRLAGAQ